MLSRDNVTMKFSRDNATMMLSRDNVTIKFSPDNATSVDNVMTMLRHDKH